MDQRTPRFLRPACLAVALVAAVALQPRGAPAQDSGDASLPVIVSFEINPTTSDSKSLGKAWIEFSWETKNADRVRLYKDGRELKGRTQLADGEIGWPLSMDGALRSQHKGPAAYELVAENSVGKASKIVEVGRPGEGRPGKGTPGKGTPGTKPPPAPARPQILSFRASPATVKSGDTVRFYWQVKGAKRVRLYDDFGEIESRIVLADGTLGWPLEMKGALMESPTRTATYKLVATNRVGTVSKSLRVLVRGRSCPVSVEITGRYSRHTDGVGVFQPAAGGSKKQVLDSPVKLVRDHRSGRTITYKTASFKLLPGRYTLGPYGSGRDDHGSFAVLYRPTFSSFTCRDGNAGKFSFLGDQAEY